MSNSHCQKLPLRLQQACPLCGELQPCCVRGIVYDMDDGSPMVCGDKGYSFCNCRDIFYTDWKNIRQDIYDEFYLKKYDCEDVKNSSIREAKKMMPAFRRFCPTAKNFLEIGSIHDHVLTYMRDSGLSVTGIDIIERPSEHNFICADFEKFCPIEPFDGVGATDKHYDVIWASHVLEHLKDPIAAVRKMKELLSAGGVLYIAMPDTFFIDWQGATLNWDWVVREHHILWCMESFIEMAEENGLKCLFRERSTDLNKQKDDSWFWKKDMKMVFAHA